MKEELILEIIGLEWEMFTSVNNPGGKAPCQEDYATFEIMRGSQAETWNDELLQSYRRDLLQAKSERRNLMAEKYARMMETTDPSAYQKLADRLPEIDGQTQELIEKIIAINLEWKSATVAKYPNLAKRGRQIYTREDTRLSTSFETYLRGELRTYSPETVQRYYQMTLEHWNRRENLEELSLLNTVKKYGYPTLDEAETHA